MPHFFFFFFFPTASFFLPHLVLITKFLAIVSTLALILALASTIPTLWCYRPSGILSLSFLSINKRLLQILAEVSTGLGPAMVGVSDIQGDDVNFRGREGGGQIPKKRKLEGKSETQLYGSSWET